MSWVNPSSWSTGQLVTKQSFLDWNNSMAAVGNHIGWTTWNPDLYSQTSAAGIEAGSDGTKRGRKLKVGKLAMCTFDFVLGTTANGAAWVVQGGAGAQLPALTPLPWAASTGAGRVAAGWAYLYDGPGDNIYLLTPGVYSANYAFYRATVAGTSLQPACVTEEWPAGLAAAPAGSRFSGLLIYRTNT